MLVATTREHSTDHKMIHKSRINLQPSRESQVRAIETSNRNSVFIRIVCRGIGKGML